MNVLIIDDDRNYHRILEKKVNEICQAADIPLTVSCIDLPYASEEENRYLHSDVILLDIDMPKISGIELASRINTLKGNAEKPYIIFVTSMDGLVFDALREQPYSFVRKDHLGDLAPCLIRIHEKLQLSDSYTIKVGRDIVSLPIRDLIYLEKSGNYVTFNTVNGEYRERTTIDEKEVDLKPYSFLRPHIGYLVNPAYIAELLPESLRMNNGVIIPVSKRYRKEIKREFYEWMVSRK